MDDKDYYYALILEKNLSEVDDSCDEKKPEVREAIEHFKLKAQKNMGIGFLNAYYIFTREEQDEWEEYAKIQAVLELYVHKYASTKQKSVDDYDLEFINYGRTELVYVLTDKTNGQKVTILAKQPVVEFGKVKQEVDNLTELQNRHSNIVAPIDYFCYSEQELYVTPYLTQARCVASDESWGMYVPEPIYRFVPFSREQEQIVNTCMIAKLVSYFDANSNQGISACKLGGGDFMLEKGWENEPLSIENTMSKLHFIAAREKVNCSLNKYLKIIRNEFARVTINEDQSSLIINHRGRVAMRSEDVEKGISMGLELLKQELNENY